MKLSKHNYTEVNFCLRCGKELHLKVDKESKLRPHCHSCGWVYYKNPVPAAAILVLNEREELLLVKRMCEPAAGEWALPSGYIEIYQSPEETAVDELKEETGLTGEIARFIGYYFGDSPICEKVLSLGFRLKVTGGKLQAGDDAEEARFIPREELPHIAFAAHRHFIRLETGWEVS